MGTDVERIASGMEDVHQLWASPLEIGLGIWLLQRQLRVACVIPVVIATGKATVILHVAKFMGPAQMRWNEAIQKRVTRTSSMLNSIKTIKMVGLEQHMFDEIQISRINEVALSKNFRTLIVGVFFFAKKTQNYPNLTPDQACRRTTRGDPG
ncbi:hypothetical protein MMC27_002930 [Xylographa pallens]|nr:hypothetical protein [Xylographa pallens]